MSALLGFGMLLAASVAFILLLPLIINYQSFEDRFQVYFFGILVKKIMFKNIESIRVCSSFDKELLQGFMDRLGNDYFKPCILISQKKGFPKKVVITPDGHEEYINKFSKYSDCLTEIALQNNEA